ncbi:signal peptidase II [Microbacterium sp. HSID17254]|jgi:signal peptidase II|uniref:Lipoprotein signal peptidase n=2 Tax=Microbacterium TaxID=33882 RepID=A0A1H1WC21_9MICO|nr:MULTISPECIES: signal peptidase II [Micrococcales]RUQ07590.1 signal peptidase II [Microbacterium sp. HSID17254]KJL25018.1 Lipoprotein signal peptidase [Microbacterium oxydans]MCI1018076.1 signal peptidase II [Microbacterium sp. C5A9]MCK8476958.1 signal peptidase II [Microbacterium aurugineum]MCT2223528.1 signal peptidase II [Microbacterium paraoxydans]
MSARVPKLAIAFAVAGATVIIDQVSKAVALAQLSTTERIPLLGDLFGLQLAFNPGAILSFGSSATPLLTAVGIAATVVLIRSAIRSRTTWWAVGIGFILGGAIGNVLDRLFAPPAFGRGYVTDFLAYSDLFIGNLADVALGVGAVVLVVGLLRRRRGPEDDVVTPPASMPQDMSEGWGRS